MRSPSLWFPVALAASLTLASVAIPGRVTVRYADIEGCAQGCDVAAGGFPVPLIADYPGISPVGSVDGSGALVGMDVVSWGRFAGTFGVWLALSVAVWSPGAVRSRGRP